jgi:hypothetical protein
LISAYGACVLRHQLIVLRRQASRVAHAHFPPGGSHAGLPADKKRSPVAGLEGVPKIVRPRLGHRPPRPTANKLYRRQPHAVRRLDQIPKSSLSVLAVEAIDCALARSSAPFFGVEKP